MQVPVTIKRRLTVEPIGGTMGQVAIAATVDTRDAPGTLTPIANVRTRPRKRTLLRIFSSCFLQGLTSPRDVARQNRRTESRERVFADALLSRHKPQEY